MHLPLISSELVLNLVEWHYFSFGSEMQNNPPNCCGHQLFILSVSVANLMSPLKRCLFWKKMTCMFALQYCGQCQIEKTYDWMYKCLVSWGIPNIHDFFFYKTKRSPLPLGTHNCTYIYCCLLFYLFSAYTIIIFATSANTLGIYCIFVL